ncbi:MAG: serine protease [Dehalococcoidales bacterium]|nr:serine protease [Dehalococcoidales bacterium]
MFTNAIAIAARFTRPVHTIARNYGSPMIQPGAATLFFVNSEGWALTCRHVANLLSTGEVLAQKSTNFKKELSARKGFEKERKVVKELEAKYLYNKNSTFEILNRFIDCVEGNLKFRVLVHPKYDVALIKFSDYTKLLCDSFPTFPADASGLQQGKYLCRLGFPFPEFTNFAYDDNLDKIAWTSSGRIGTPRFPIEGMVTRHLVDEKDVIFAFEMSTPGLKGQSGGPAFDTQGRVWGMQFATNHLDLDFDINQEVLRQGKKKQVTDSAFLHVGYCIHADILKSFMKENGLNFSEG